MTHRTILLLGGTGFIGSRLVSGLLQKGNKVRVAYRKKTQVLLKPWARQVQLVQTNTFDRVSLREAMDGVDVVYYFIHAMEDGVHDFEELDRVSAINTAEIAEDKGVGRIIYLGALYDKTKKITKHLRSRQAVEDIFKAGSVPSTVFRAAIILGAGSVAFEILRYLTERAPVMLVPPGLRTLNQPISVHNVLHYLTHCLEIPATVNDSFDIGGPEIVTYHDLIRLYNKLADLPKRILIPSPFLPLQLGSYWIPRITGISRSIVEPLLYSLTNPAIVQDQRIQELIPQNLYTVEESIKLILSERPHRVVRNKFYPSLTPPEWSMPGDPRWSGGYMYKEHRIMRVEATPREVWAGLERMGGKKGYFYWNWSWQLRGLMDQVTGGLGLADRREKPNSLQKGDKFDLWHVLKADEEQRLLLWADMALPGYGTLDFIIRPVDSSTSEVHEIIRFVPRGLMGYVYWSMVYFPHQFVLPGLLTGLMKFIDRPIISGPKRIDRSPPIWLDAFQLQGRIGHSTSPP